MRRRYCYSKRQDIHEEVRKRQGETNFLFSTWAVTGKNEFEMLGSGSRYQVDATVVNQRKRKRRKDEVKQFPEGYPENLIDQIKECGGEFKAEYVYRIIGYGFNDPRSYWSSYQEMQNGIQPLRKKLDIGHYSTSCDTNQEVMKDRLKFTGRKYPRPVIGEGYTAPCCGPILKAKTNTHVHWWIFKDSEPWKHFKEMSEINE